jgi:DNA-directed RNA polymerase specialized sigma subunit
MTAKEYLNQVKHADQSINFKVEQLAMLDDLAKRTSVVYSELPHGQPDHTSTQKILCKKIDLEAEVAAAVGKMVDLKLDILGTLDLLCDNTQQLILAYRYLSFKRWEDIAAMLNICIRDVYRLHGIGIKKVNEVLKIGSKSH